MCEELLDAERLRNYESSGGRGVTIFRRSDVIRNGFKEMIRIPEKWREQAGKTTKQAAAWGECSTSITGKKGSIIDT